MPNESVRVLSRTISRETRTQTNWSLYSHMIRLIRTGSLMTPQLPNVTESVGENGRQLSSISISKMWDLWCLVTRQNGNNDSRERPAVGSHQREKLHYKPHDPLVDLAAFIVIAVCDRLLCGNKTSGSALADSLVMPKLVGQATNR